jgi:anti-sigma-K factor RskA
VSDHLAYEESVGSYLLGALPEDEHHDFEAHLEDCDPCRLSVASLRIAADALPISAPPVAAPPELRDRIMQVVRSEAQLLDAAGSRADRPERVPRRLRLPSLLARPALAWAAAAVLLVVGGVAGFALNGGGGGGGGVRTVAADVSAPGATASLRVADHGATLDVRGLRNPAPGRIYQVWLKRAGETPEPTNALFTVRSDGTASVDVPGDVRHFDQVLVTSEPRGGSEVPTTQPIIHARPA